MNSKIKDTFILLILALSVLPMSGQEKDILNINSLSSVKNSTQENDFFNAGYAEVKGKIEDFDAKAGVSNFLVYFDDNLIGKLNPITVPIADDGTFTAWIPLTTPGFARFVSDNRYFDLFLEAGKSLEVAFNWAEASEYLDKVRKGEDFSEYPFKFEGDLGRINRDLYEFPKERPYHVYQAAHDLTPDEAIKVITDEYEKRLRAVNEYTNGKSIDPTAKKLLIADAKGQYLVDIFQYASTRENYETSDTLAPSLRKPLDLHYFEPIKDILLNSDEWIIATKHTHQLTNLMAFSPILQLLGYKDRYIYDFGINALTYLKSLGAELTPEEEAINEYLGEGGKKSCTLSGLNKYLHIAREVAQKNGLSEQLAEFYELNRDTTKLTPKKILTGDALANVRNSNDAIKRYFGVEEVPLLWQIMQSHALRSKYTLNSEHYNKENLFNILGELKISGEIQNQAILEALDNYYHREFALKSFTIPSDERGRVIKDIIKPYEGKFLLLDFWDITCGSCCYAIKNSVKSREKNRNNPKFKMLFISEDTGSSSRYEDFVSEYLDGETCISIKESDFNLLRDLFSFSGIPHYVLIGPDGSVLDSDFSFYGMKKSLHEYGVELEGDVLDELK